MKADEFFAMREDEAAKRGEALHALWWEARGGWARAHQFAQAAGEADDADAAKGGAWVHAYLRRVEGNEANASYWYGRAGRRPPVRGTPFEEERRAIATALLQSR